MKSLLAIVLASSFCVVRSLTSTMAGTWADDFSESSLGREWNGDTNFFSISNGLLKGVSISPLAPAPFNVIEVGHGWSNYVVQCLIDVVTPNLAVCSKGALVLRHSGSEGYVFALHVATKTIEVYRLSTGEILLSKDAPLEFKQWHQVRAELQGEQMTFFVDDQLIGTVTDNKSLSGAVGLAVQDTAETDFDNFSVTGPSVPSNGLDAVLTGDKITLVWPNSLTNYGIVASPQIAPVPDWRGVTNLPLNDGGYFRLSLELAPSNRFYRLDPTVSTNAFR
jgi:hypothetical protein